MGGSCGGTVQAGMHLTLVRHATLLVRAAGLHLLVDPQLDPRGAREPVPGTPNPRPTPLVDLPEPAEAVVDGVDAVLVTHLHGDHFDETARRLLPRGVALVCQPPDADRLRADGFTDVRPVEEELTLGALRIARTGGEHGRGEIGAKMAPVSGFVLHAPGEPTLYIAGDTILAEPVRAALREHDPAVVVVNAGAAQFLEGGPIVMDADDVVALARETTALVVAVHFETVSHSTQTRADLHERLRAEGLTHKVVVPEDGSEVPLD
jgi:L-ascorbate metabolism protein UlaG (beta-lactamase superfamily)